MVLLILRSGTKAPSRSQRGIPGLYNLQACYGLTPHTPSYDVTDWSDYYPGPGVVQVVGRRYCHIERLPGGDEQRHGQRSVAADDDRLQPQSR